jgi:hypothetical protein
MPTEFTEYGFSLIFERGANVQAIDEASQSQGALSFAYGQVNAIVTWLPQGNSPFTLVSGTYNLIQSSQPDLVFETLADGDLLVDGESGLYLGFKAVDASGAASGGLIGSWDCATSGTSFTLTLSGEDAALVQVRFDELLDSFACEVSS